MLATIICSSLRVLPNAIHHMLDVEINLGHVNSEDELEKWEDELTEKYPEIMRMID